MQQLEEIQQEQLTEKKTAEELDAEIVEVTGEGFSVRLQRKIFTAEAVEGAEGKTLTFDERSEVEEFSAGFVEQHYTGVLPDAWEILQELMDTETVEVPASNAGTPVLPPLEGTRPSAPEPPSLPGIQENTEGKLVETGRPREMPYEEFEPDDHPIVYEKGGEDEIRFGGGKRYTGGREEIEEVGEESVEFLEMPGYENRVKGESRNAVEVVEEMFEESGIEGTVEEASEYGVTDDFEGEMPEAYWVDIEGMDMDRTEYFINGELAADSIDQYELGPGDSIVFVESEVFYSEPGEASYCGGETLELADLEAGEISSIDSYTVPDIPSLGKISAEYMASA